MAFKKLQNKYTFCVAKLVLDKPIKAVLLQSPVYVCSNENEWPSSKSIWEKTNKQTQKVLPPEFEISIYCLLG